MIRSTILPASPPPFSSALLLRAPQDHPDDGGGVSDDSRSIGPDDVEPEIDPMDLAPADRPPTEGFKRFYTDRSLGYFYLDNPLRRACIHVQESPYFDNFILLAILLNALLLCWMEPLEMEDRGCGASKNDSSTGGNELVELTEPIFTAVFTIECAIKIMAQSFLLDDTSYLKDGWNVLDFTVVVISLLSLVVSGGNLSALRVVRVLRPLRTLSILKGMRVLIGTIFKSIPMIANVLLFCVFLFTVFGIFGLQMFMGVMRNRCFEVVPGTTCGDHEGVLSDLIYCRDVVPDASFASQDVAAAVLQSANDEEGCTNLTIHWAGTRCANGSQMCLKGNNPNYGITSFDDIGHAFLLIFQCITLEGWTPIMYLVQQSLTGWTFIYFLLLVFIGAFFLLNLALAVMTEVYDEENTRAKLEAEQQAEEEDEKEAIAERKEAEARAKRHDKGIYTDDEEDSDDENLRRLQESIIGGGGGVNVRAFCKAIINASWFGPLFVVLIIANTIVLAMAYDGMSDSYEKGLDTANLVFTIMFILELVLKVVGMGVEEYGKDPFNKFDAAIVLMSIIELAFSSGGGLTALRAFRIMRVLKLIRSWTSLQAFLYSVWLTICELGNFGFIILLTIFIFTLLGMQTFGGKMCGLDDGAIPRHNFDTLLWAAVTVFQILTGEDWNAVMYDGMEASGGVTALYFVALIVMGNFLVLNLFVAILLTNFGQQQVESTHAATRKLLDGLNFFKYFSKEKGKLSKDTRALLFWDTLPDKNYDPEVVARWESIGEKLFQKIWDDEDEKRREEEMRVAMEEADRLARIEEERKRSIVEIKSARQGRLMSAFALGEAATDVASCKRMPGAAPKPLDKYENKSLNLFDATNPARRFCFAVVDDKQFDYLIMVFILISSLTMAFESPKALKDDRAATAFEAIDITFTIIFGMEMVAKIIAFGLYQDDDGAYLRDPWNCMDCFIVVIGIVGKCLQGQNISWVRALRTLRALRPLRTIGRIPELKVVVNALFKSMPGLFNVAVIALLFWLIFGILGMTLFMGAFASCSDADVTNRPECVDGYKTTTSDREWSSITRSCNDATISTQAACAGTYSATAWTTRVWSSPSDTGNFNHIGNAMQTLFEMSTTEGWTTVMYNGVDARSDEMAPERNYNPAATLYFVSFMVVANFFILNLFVGIILDNFAKLASASADGGSGLMTKAQQQWVRSQQKYQRTAAPVQLNYYPESKERTAVYKVIESKNFEWFIMSAIMANAVTMAAESYGQADSTTRVLEGFGYFFFCIFLLEAIAKLYAMYPKAYFNDRWNCFDFFCVCTTIIGYIIGGGGIASMFRLFRLARVFRLIRTLKGLRMLFNTLVMSFPSLINIGGLLFLLMFVYGVLGMNIFGKVKFGEHLNEQANFRDFGMSLMLLLRTVTGEAWNAIMYDCMNTSDCDSNVDCEIGECCGSEGAPLYFITFVVFGSFITLNLLIAVVLDNFSNNKKQDTVTHVSEDDVEDFAEAWKKVDPHATGFIQMTKLAFLLNITSPPLGVKGKNLSRLGLLRFQKNLNLRVDSNYLHYQDVLQALTSHAMGIEFDKLPTAVQVALEAGKARTKQQSERQMKRLETHKRHAIKHGIKGEDGEEYDVAQMFAVERMQAAFRGFQARKKARLEAEEASRRRGVEKAELILAHVKGILAEVEAGHLRGECDASGRELPGGGRRVVRDSAAPSEDSARASPSHSHSPEERSQGGGAAAAAAATPRDAAAATRATRPPASPGSPP